MFHQKLNEIGSRVKETFLKDHFIKRVEPNLLKEAVIAYPSRGGKSLRPALLLWSCGLFCNQIERAWKIAAAVELYHIWTLVHDDIIDNDNFRRGKPSVHTLVETEGFAAYPGNSKKDIREFGRNFAILGGDIQQAWANTLILESYEDGVSYEVIHCILRRLNHDVNPELISGEALDVEFSLRAVSEISPNEMRKMLLRKTGKLFRFAAEAGSLIGLSIDDLENEDVKCLGDFAEKAALAFQLQDDLLGLMADEKKLGKPVGSDIREGKKTLLTSIGARNLNGNELAFFLRMLGNKALNSFELEKVQQHLVASGAVDEVEKEISELLTDAKSLLYKMKENDYRNLLAEWIDFIGKRTY